MYYFIALLFPSVCSVQTGGDWETKNGSTHKFSLGHPENATVNMNDPGVVNLGFIASGENESGSQAVLRAQIQMSDQP